MMRPPASGAVPDSISSCAQASTNVSLRGLHPRWRSSRVSDGLVGEEDEAVADGAGVDEAHGFHGARLAEQTLACPNYAREGHQPQLVDEVVLHQGGHEPSAGVDHDVTVDLLLQPRDLV